MLITRWRTRETKRAVAPLDGRGLEALFDETSRLARTIRFFGLDGREDGSWDSLLRDFQPAPAMAPHVALLLASAKLLRHSQDAFNTLPDRIADRQRRTLPGGAAPAAGRLGAGGTARDLERLVLDRFEAVDSVRVLPARDSSGRPRAGHVLVLASSNRAAAKGRPIPDRLRERIRSALASATSPLACIHLPEPPVSLVDVRVTATFRGRRGPERLEAHLRRLLSLRGSRRLDLPDDCSPAALRDEITRFIRTRPYVVEIAKVEVQAESKAAVSIPAAGRIAIDSIPLGDF
jgi:hypothetical protein